MKIILTKQFWITLLLMHFLDMLKIPSTFMVRESLGLPFIVPNLVNSIFLFQNGNLILGTSNISPWWIKDITRNAWWAHDRKIFTNLHQHSKAAPFHTTLQNRNSGWKVVPLFLDSHPFSVSSMEIGYRKLSARPCKRMVWMGLFSACSFAELALRQLLFLEQSDHHNMILGRKILNNIKYFNYRGNGMITTHMRV